MKSLHAAVVAALLLLPLGACQSTSIGQAAFGEDAASLADRPDVDFHASDRPVVIGIAQFQSGNYGKAEQAFRKATELTPTDGAAWLGLAAAYDRLRRFDAADVAYRQAAKYVGSRPSTTTMSATPTCCGAISARRGASSSRPTSSIPTIL